MQFKSTKTTPLAVQFKDGSVWYLKKSVAKHINFDAYGLLDGTFAIGKQAWTKSRGHAAKFTPIEANTLGSDVNTRVGQGFAAHISYAIS